MPATTYTQHPLVLPSLGRGSHLITPFIQSSLKKEIDVIQCGLLHLFVQHTSCALSLNENWDEDVRKDMSDALDKIVVEDKVRNLPLFSFFFFLVSPPSSLPAPLPAPPRELPGCERERDRGGTHSAVRCIHNTRNRCGTNIHLNKTPLLPPPQRKKKPPPQENG